MKKLIFALLCIVLCVAPCVAAGQDTSASQLEKLIAEGKVPAYIGHRGSFSYNPKFSNIVICGDNVRLRSQPTTKSNIIGMESWDMVGTISFLGEWTHPDGTKWLVGLYDDGSNTTGTAKVIWVSAQYAKAVTQEKPLSTNTRFDVYMNAAKAFVEKHIMPDGTKIDDEEIMDDFANNKLAICDVDGDGQPELIVQVGTGTMASMLEFVCGFDEKTGKLIEKYVGYPNLEYFDNGCIKEGVSHNQGLAGEFWPYSVSKYNRGKGKYEQVGSVDAWSREEYPTNSFEDDKPFPQEIDVVNDGFVYYIDDKDFKEADDPENPVDTPIYKRWVSKWLGEAKPINPEWVSADAKGLARLSTVRDIVQKQYTASSQPELGAHVNLQDALRAELFQPSGKQDITKIKSLIEAGADINYHVEVPENEKQIFLERPNYSSLSGNPAGFKLEYATMALKALPKEQQQIFLNSCPYITQAALLGRPDIVEILLDLGADVTILSMENRKVLDYFQALELQPLDTWKNSPVYGRLQAATSQAEKSGSSSGKTMQRPSGPSGKLQRYVVTDRLLPVFKGAIYIKPEGYQVLVRANKPYGGWLLVPHFLEDSIATILAYGDVVDGYPFQSTTGEYIRVTSSTSPIGFADFSSMSPMPEYDPFTPFRHFQVKKDTIPCLLPGKHPISNYSHFILPRGAVIMAEGRAIDENGTSWILCHFDTDEEDKIKDSWIKRFLEDDDFFPQEYAGSGHRYAWLPEENLVDLASYAPTLSCVDDENLPDGISRDAREFLKKSGFYIDPSPVFTKLFIDQSDLIDCYERMSKDTPKFITADLPLHALHLYFERSMKQVEEKALFPRMMDLVTALRMALRKLPKGTSDLERRAMGNVSNFLDLAQYLLTGQGSTGNMREFAGRILKGEGWGENPFTERQENFSLYSPSGHYTVNDTLKAYFRTTCLLATIWPLDSETGAAATLILNKLLDEPDVARCWHSLYDPMKALVGRSNVNSYEDLSEVLKSFKLKDLGSISRVHDLMDALDHAGRDSTLRKPAGMLSPSGKKFALLPRRVTFDAIVFNTLTSPETGSKNKPRNMPDPLDVMAVLGSEPARDEVKRYADFRNYEDNLTKLSEVWPTYAESEDGSNVYTSVLSALRAYFTAKGSKQFFANSPAWGYKKLTTAGAALAELNHDNKVYPETDGLGDGTDSIGTAAGPFSLPLPLGYLEPVPELYNALSNIAGRLADTFEFLIPDLEKAFSDTNLFTMPLFPWSRLREFAEEMNALSDIAVHARNDTMTYEDFVFLQHLSLPLIHDGICILQEDEYENYVGGEQLGIALIVNSTAGSKENLAKGGTPALYTATGTPRKIYVYINDKSGGYRLTEGYMYSYYTFDQTTAGHIDDDAWRAKVYNENADVQEELKKLLPYWHEKMYQ